MSGTSQIELSVSFCSGLASRKLSCLQKKPSMGRVSIGSGQACNQTRRTDPLSRDVAQPGRALRSGRRSRWFESSRPDHFKLDDWMGAYPIWFERAQSAGVGGQGRDKVQAAKRFRGATPIQSSRFFYSYIPWIALARSFSISRNSNGCSASA